MKTARVTVVLRLTLIMIASSRFGIALIHLNWAVGFAYVPAAAAGEAAQGGKGGVGHSPPQPHLS